LHFFSPRQKRFPPCMLRAGRMGGVTSTDRVCAFAIAIALCCILVPLCVCVCVCVYGILFHTRPSSKPLSRAQSGFFLSFSFSSSVLPRPASVSSRVEPFSHYQSAAAHTALCPAPPFPPPPPPHTPPDLNRQSPSLRARSPRFHPYPDSRL
jgi:hypothetical protein